MPATYFIILMTTRYYHIGGQKRAFTFSMFANALYFEFMAKHGDIGFNAGIGIIYGALKANEKENNLPKDFGMQVLCDWIEEMPQEDYDEIVELGMKDFTARAAKKKMPLMKGLTQGISEIYQDEPTQ